jgi:hypothetical protein
MRQHRLVKGAAPCAAPAAVLAAALLLGAAAAAHAQSSSRREPRDDGPTSTPVYPTEQRHLTGPLEICDFGSFYVPGVPKVTQYANSVTPGPWQQLNIGQMYVQFMVPRRQRGWPVIMVHGGGYTGSSVESTPDGDEGWFAYAVRKNFPTYVVDQAGRGRSGFDRSFINERIATGNLADFPNLGNTSSSGIWTAWFGHLLPAGSDITNGTLIRHGDPGDPQCAADPEHCTFHPRHNFGAVDPEIEAREGAIGPAPDPANNRALALAHYNWGVPNTNVTLPNSTCESCDPTTVNGADTWSGRGLAKLVAGLGGAVVVTHSQAGSVGHHMVRYLKEAGKLSDLKGLITIDGVCSLAASGTAASDYVGIPYLAFRGYYPGINASCIPTVAAINAAGGRADYVTLADPVFGDRFKGVTHMMMLGENHLEVLDVILDWARVNISRPPARNSCGPARHSSR